MKQLRQTANVPYTTPVISTSNKKDCYIFFEFLRDGIIHKRKIRKGINRYKGKEQQLEAEALYEATKLKY